MRILILSNSDSGLFQFRGELIKELSIDSNVICCVPNEDGYIGKLEQLGCKCIETPFNRRSINPIQDLILLNSYRKLIKSIQPSIVLTYTIKPNVYGGIACQQLKVPYIANITGLGTSIENGGIISRIAMLLYRIGLRRASCVFFQNCYNQNTFIKKNIISGKSRLIPGSGVNVDFHKFEPYPEDTNMFRFLFVGRVMKDKGIEELLSAIDMLNSKGEKIFLDVVGGYDQDYSKNLTEYEKKGILKYHGKQNDVHKFYKNAHCVVLPSYHEGMANVMLEAAATGRPVITTNIPGCQETFIDGITGLGCDPKDVKSLYISMKKMLDLTWNQRNQMGIAGRNLVSQKFDRKIIVNAYKEEILTTVNERRK